MQQNFDKLKEFFENYDEQNLRSLEDEVLSSHMEHYKRRLVPQFKEFKGLDILDIGCGDGRATREFAILYPENKFLAIDLSEKNIQIAKEKNQEDNIKYMQMDLSKNIDLPQKFDLIYSFSVIQYFDNKAYLDLTNKLFSILKEAGIIIHMSIPDKDFFWKVRIGNKLLSPFKLMVRYPMHIKDYLKNRYLNGFWWNKTQIKQIGKDKFNIITLSSDSYYRFDVILRKKIDQQTKI